MAKIDFTPAEKAILVDKIKDYFSERLDQEIDRFDAEFLITFISSELGPYYYNRGLYDAQQILEERTESVRAAILELEEPTEFLR